jgi:NADPH-dependent ferric siderophore reductase
MGRPPEKPATVRTRREPPRFRTVAVRGVEARGPRLTRVTLGGAELASLTIDQPAASVRLLLPAPARALVLPAWNGNEFLLPDGSRPPIRTFTPRRFDPDTRELDVEVVRHGAGAASEWVAAVQPGDSVAVSGPGRGYVVDEDAPAFLLAGDETAIPAISQLLDVLPRQPPVDVYVEVAHPDGRLDLPEHPHGAVTWHDLAPGAPPGDALVDAVRGVDLVSGSRVWVAGEAAAVQRIRRHLFEDRRLPRASTTVRGYWKRGARGDGDDDA